MLSRANSLNLYFFPRQDRVVMIFSVRCGSCLCTKAQPEETHAAQWLRSLYLTTEQVKHFGLEFQCGPRNVSCLFFQICGVHTTQSSLLHWGLYNFPCIWRMFRVWQLGKLIIVWLLPSCTLLSFISVSCSTSSV